jgi:predicted transposase YbfD/YdcC
LSSLFVSNIYKHFENITDPRINRGCNFPLVEMIFLTLAATICDANCWADVERYGNAKLDWLRKYFPFENGIPSHDTLGRVFSRLHPIEFYAALESWTYDIAGSLKGQTVAIDGKTLRGSFDTASSKSPLHSITAWACGLRMCIGAMSVDSKSNEIPAVQRLVEHLDIQGAVVTADAMHCQKETAKIIHDKGADYILQVKGNQPSLENALNDEIMAALEEEIKTIRTHKKTEMNRSREEFRELVVMPCPKNSSVFQDWTGLKTIGMMYRSRTINGQLEEHVSSFITSLPCRVRDISNRIRSHWGIENTQHYTLDVTFTEDSSRIRNGTGPEISSVFRRLALNILQKDTSLKDSIRGKRKRCGWDNTAIESVMACFTRD